MPLDTLRPTVEDAGPPAIRPPPSGMEPEVEIPPAPGTGEDARRTPTRRPPRPSLPTIWVGSALVVLRGADGVVLGTWGDDDGLGAGVMRALSAVSAVAFVVVDTTSAAGRMLAASLRTTTTVRVLDASTHRRELLAELVEVVEHGEVVHRLQSLAGEAAMSPERAEQVRVMLDRKRGSERLASIPHTPPPPPLQKWLRWVGIVVTLLGTGVLVGLAVAR